jgi:integrase
MGLILKKLDGKFEGEIKIEEELSLDHEINAEQVRESDIYKQLTNLPKWKLHLVTKACTLARKDKYQRNKHTKYGNLPRSMTQEQLKTFFSSIRNPQLKKELLLQFFLALRVGEISSIKIVKGQDLIQILNKKCDRVEYLPLFEPLRTLLKDDLNFCIHTKDYIRKCFRSVRDKAGLNFSYGMSNKGKPLYQFTTHSLRHTAINLFGAHVKDPYKVCQYSRHLAENIVGVQATYRHYSIEELRHDLEECFIKYKNLLE